MYLTETHAQVRDMARAFAGEVLDHEEQFPNEIYDQMAGLGVFGIGVPEALGGPGFGTLAYALIMQELSRGYASVADQCGLVALISTLRVRHGTPAQHALLRAIRAMKTKVACCISEREAGTDVSGIRTTVVRTGDGWAPDKGRVGIATFAIGIGLAGFAAAGDCAATRKQFGKAIAEFQGVQWMLADMVKDIEAARLLVHSAACKIDAGQDATNACLIAKCFAGDMAVQRTADAGQVFGGSGYIWRFEVERLYRDAKITQIYEGTNQIQRMIIARELMKKKGAQG